MKTLIKKFMNLVSPSRETIESVGIGSERASNPRESYNKLTKIHDFKIEQDSDGNQVLVLSRADGIKTFRATPFKGSLYGVLQEITESGLEIPSSEDIIDLLYAPFSLGLRPEFDSIPYKYLRCYESEIANGFSYNGGIILPNKNIWTPKGVYVQQIRSLEDAQKPSEISELEESLNDAHQLPKGILVSKDRKIRFAPKTSYEGDIHLPGLDFKDCHACNVDERYCDEKLSSDGFVIASVGLDGARKLEKTIFKLYSYIGHPVDFRIRRYNVKEGTEPKESFTDITDIYKDWTAERALNGTTYPSEHYQNYLFGGEK